MAELKGYDYLKRKLKEKKVRVNLRYNYYDMKKDIEHYSKLIPAEYRWLSHTLGWCAKSVDAIANRLDAYGFQNDNFYMEEIYNQNNKDVLFDSAILSSLISSCSFIFISQTDGYPTFQVIDGGHATGIIDDMTHMLTEGYAVLEKDTQDNPVLEVYCEPGRTTYYLNGEVESVVENVAPYPLLVPVIYRPDARRPFGHSRITRACMGLQQGAMRTIRRSEVSAEFYSLPQRYVLGLSDEAEFNGSDAAWSKFLRFDEDEEGNQPSVGQFPQQSMAPFIEQLKMFASLFAGESGLTIDDLGFPSVNPSSAESIKAAHENLKLTARKAQKTFSTGFINAGYLGACLRDGKDYQRHMIYQTKVAWEPIFEPDSAMLSSIGDGVLKINQAIPDYISKDTMRGLTGIEHE